MSRKPKGQDQTGLRIDSEVVRQIRQHARSENKTEVCGVLIGRETAEGIEIKACIAGVNAAQGGAHVTFTQDTWEHIYKIKDKEHPNERILGWYHSHPGFGVFLSDHDTFIHKNFFSSPRQVAWVYDPHSDEEGCFGWQESRIVRLTCIAIVDRRGGERADNTSKPEPIFTKSTVDDFAPKVRLARVEGDVVSEEDSLQRLVGAVLSHLSVLLLGFAISYFLFPKIMVMAVPIDPRTGQPMGPMIEVPAKSILNSLRAAPSNDEKPNEQPKPAAPAGTPAKEGDAQH
jgi:proteasome lid subunit RPN8/RPN11